MLSNPTAASDTSFSPSKPTLPSKSSTPLITGSDPYQPSTDFDEPFVYTSAEVTEDKLVLQATLYGFHLHDHTTMIRADVTIGTNHQSSHVAFCGHGTNRQFQRQTACAMLAAIVAGDFLCSSTSTSTSTNTSSNSSVDQNCYVTLRPHVNLDLEIKEYAQLGFVQVDQTFKQGIRLIANIGDVLNNSGWSKIDSVIVNPPCPVYTIALSKIDQEALQRLRKRHSDNTSKRSSVNDEEQDQPTFADAKRHCKSPLL
jgi:hypothetical protein